MMTEDFNKWAKYVADIERLETENSELTTHINELEKERVQLDDVINELSSKCGQLEYDRDALAVMKDELSSKTEQLEKKLHIAVDYLKKINDVCVFGDPQETKSDIEEMCVVRVLNALNRIKEVK